MNAVPSTITGFDTLPESKEWYVMFKAFDIYNDGYIPAVTLAAAVRECSNQLSLNVHETELLLHKMDVNKDKKIGFTEFTNLMLRAKHMQMHRLMIYAALSVLPKNEQAETTRYLLQYSCIPPPLFLVTISLMQLLIYLYYAINSGYIFSIDKPIPFESIYILNPNKKNEIWRYFTYMFIHIGYMHLITNLGVQILLGIPLELVHKFWRIGLIYILGVMSSALLFFVFNDKMYLAGASGGVYAILSAHIANVVINWSEMKFNWFRTIFLTIFIGTDVAIFVKAYFFTKQDIEVSYISHCGGFIAGLLLGIVILRNLKKKTWEAYAWWVSLTLFVFYVSVCLILIFM